MLKRLFERAPVGCRRRTGTTRASGAGARTSSARRRTRSARRSAPTRRTPARRATWARSCSRTGARTRRSRSSPTPSISRPGTPPPTSTSRTASSRRTASTRASPTSARPCGSNRATRSRAGSSCGRCSTCAIGRRWASRPASSSPNGSARRTAPPPASWRRSRRFSCACPGRSGSRSRAGTRRASPPRRRRMRSVRARRRRRGGRLRVGYVSADFSNHATAHLTAGMFEQHDRSRFEMYAYSFGPDDGSDYRRRIRRGVRALRRRAPRARPRDRGADRARPHPDPRRPEGLHDREPSGDLRAAAGAAADELPRLSGNDRGAVDRLRGRRPRRPPRGGLRVVRRAGDLAAGELPGERRPAGAPRTGAGAGRLRASGRRVRLLRVQPARQDQRRHLRRVAPRPRGGTRERAVAARGTGRGAPARGRGGRRYRSGAARLRAANADGEAPRSAPARAAVPRHRHLQRAHDCDRRAVDGTAGPHAAGCELRRPRGGEPAAGGRPAGAGGGRTWRTTSGAPWRSRARPIPSTRCGRGSSRTGRAHRSSTRRRFTRGMESAFATAWSRHLAGAAPAPFAV